MTKAYRLSFTWDMTGPSHIQLELSDFNNWKVLSIKGRVDSFCDKRVIAQIRQMLGSEQGPRRWIFDLSAADFVSIIFIREMLLIHKEMKANFGQIVFLNPQIQVRKYLDSFSGILGPKIFKSEQDLRFELGLPAAYHSHDFSPAAFNRGL